jgi:hypothetical protein
MFYSNPAFISPQGKDLTSSDERQPLRLGNYVLVIPQKVVTPVKTGVQRIFVWWKELDSGACPGPDPGFAGMTNKPAPCLFATPSSLIFGKSG